MIIFVGGSKQMNNENVRFWQQLPNNTDQMDDEKEFYIENAYHHNKMYLTLRLQAIYFTF